MFYERISDKEGANSAMPNSTMHCCWGRPCCSFDHMRNFEPKVALDVARVGRQGPVKQKFYQTSLLVAESPKLSWALQSPKFGPSCSWAAFCSRSSTLNVHLVGRYVGHRAVQLLGRLFKSRKGPTVVPICAQKYFPWELWILWLCPE